MCSWFGRRLIAIQAAISLPGNAEYRLSLEIALSKLLDLQHSWSTEGTSKNYAEFVQNAPSKARQIYISKMGASSSAPCPLDLQLREAITAPLVLVPDADPEMAEGDDQLESDLILTPTQVIMETLTHGEGVDYAADTDQNVGSQSPPLSPEELHVVTQVPLCRDEQVLMRLSTGTTNADPSSRRVLYLPSELDPNDSRRFVFDPDELEIIRGDDSRLTCNGINNCAALLSSILSQSDVAPKVQRCCVFSSYDILKARYSVGIDRLWRCTRNLGFWKKKLWILPVHRAYPMEHWVCMAIIPENKRIYVFDSLHNDSAWTQELQARVYSSHTTLSILY
ncbi:hypothetical protein FA13DRAFT_1806693 [Coprinellus micaceus]|uniref:Ubiquitin-like protease family profile domain-containing protein n=1 Tax=Coprinellus micaceus TaxID=71717 RepID=A0A4Y7RKQ7_COPMI|nr:hypothetical protein FA13DRAFT_1806693 [Coprinellus micaceus]